MDEAIEILDYAKDSGVLFTSLVTIAIIVTIVLLFVHICRKTLKPFLDKYVSIQNTIEDKNNKLEEHSKELVRLQEEFNKIQEQMLDGFDELKGMYQSLSDLNNIQNEMQIQINIGELKHIITSHCNTAIDNGKISASELGSLMELNDLYETIGGNSFVHILMKKVEQLPIVNDDTEVYLNAIKARKSQQKTQKKEV